MKVGRFGWLLLLFMLLAGGSAGLPAALLDWPIRYITHGMWRLAMPQGTLWYGQAHIMFVGQGGTVLPVSRMQWAWQPARLFSGYLGWHVYSDGVPATVEWRPNQWKIDGLALSIPFAAVSELTPLWKGAGLSGQLDIQINGLTYQQEQYHGTVRATLLGATSRLTPVAPLGSYALDIAGTGKGLVLHIGTLRGDLAIDSNGTWSPGGSLSIEGEAKSTPERYEALKPLLSMLGRPSGQTSVHWQFK